MKNCVFFQNGYCKKGENCTFAHTEVLKAKPIDLEGDIQRQVEYWLSDENFAKDAYLQQQVDKNGWFPRMQKLTTDLDAIARAIQSSSRLQLSSDRKMVRRSSADDVPTEERNSPPVQYNFYPPSMPFMDLQQYPFTAGSKDASSAYNYNLAVAAYPNPYLYAHPLYAFPTLPYVYQTMPHMTHEPKSASPTPNEEKSKRPKTPVAWSSSPSSTFVISPPCPQTKEPISSSYLDTMLHLRDAFAYKAAGVLPFRYKHGKAGSKRMQVLLGVEDAYSLVLLGGHRTPIDKDTVATAAREFGLNTGDAKAMKDIEGVLRRTIATASTSPVMVLWYREARYVLYMLQLPFGTDLSHDSQHRKHHPQKEKPKINKLAWVDVNSLLEALRNGMIAEAIIKQGDTTYGICGTTRNVLSQRPLLTHLNAMLSISE